MDIKGKGRQPWESYDDYCSRVDDEIREAGEDRSSSGWWVVPYFLAIVAVIGYLLWRYFQ